MRRLLKKLLAILGVRVKRGGNKIFIEIPAPPNITNSKYFSLGQYVLVWKKRESIWEGTGLKESVGYSLFNLAPPSPKYRQVWADILQTFYDLLQGLRMRKRRSQLPRILNSVVHGLSLILPLLDLWGGYLGGE